LSMYTNYRINSVHMKILNNLASEQNKQLSYTRIALEDKQLKTKQKEVKVKLVPLNKHFRTFGT
jgi:hypothetical protein